MSESGPVTGGLKAIIVFYAIGVVVVSITLFTNRVAIGQQLATVHGFPALAIVPAFALTILMGILVIIALNSMRPWGFWLVMAYMAFLLFVPPLALGPRNISPFANVLWPIFVTIYLFTKRRSFDVHRQRSA